MEQNSKTKINRVKKDISNPKSFTAPDELRQQLMETMKSLYSDEDIEMVSRAYDMAFEAHKDQKRKSGEPYIIHPICVAIILAELELDRETIIAGLLHDVVEDTDVTYEDVVRGVWGGGCPACGRCHEVGPVKLFQGQDRSTGGEFTEDVPCHGQGHQGHTDQTGRPSAQHAHHAVYEA